jgi:hypothetical protein
VEEKVVLIGVGSAIFTRGLITDLIKKNFAKTSNVSLIVFLPENSPSTAHEVLSIKDDSECAERTPPYGK